MLSFLHFIPCQYVMWDSLSKFSFLSLVQLLSMTTLFGAIFCLAAFCFKSLIAYVIIFSIGELLIFATQVNFLVSESSLMFMLLYNCIWCLSFYALLFFHAFVTFSILVYQFEVCHCSYYLLSLRLYFDMKHKQLLI